MTADSFLSKYGFNKVMETLIESTHSTIVVTRVTPEQNFELVFVNDTFFESCKAHMILESKEEILGQTLGRVFAKNLGIRLSDVDRLKLLLAWVNKTQQKIEYVDEFHVEGVGNAVFNTSLIPMEMGEDETFIFYIANNITDLINRERELKQHRNELSMILNNIHDSLTLLEVDTLENGEVQFLVRNINDSALKIFQRIHPKATKEDIIGKEASVAFDQFKVLPDEEIQRNVRLVRNCYDQRRVIETEQAWYHPDGSLNAYMMVKHIPVFNENGILTNILRVARDVTEQHLANIALQENEQRLSMAMTVSEVGSFDWDPIANTSKVNDIHNKIFEVEEVSENPLEKFFSLLHPEDRDRMMDAMNRMMTDETYPDNTIEDYRVVTSSGKTKWVRTHSRVERNMRNEVTRVIGTVCDVTAEKEYEAQLLRHNRELKALNRILEERETILLDAVFHTSHKLRRPLANILALGDLLKDCKNLKSEEKTTIDYIIQSISELDEEVKDLDNRLSSFGQVSSSENKKNPA